MGREGTSGEVAWKTFQIEGLACKRGLKKKSHVHGSAGVNIARGGEAPDKLRRCVEHPRAGWTGHCQFHPVNSGTLLQNFKRRGQAPGQRG